MWCEFHHWNLVWLITIWNSDNPSYLWINMSSCDQNKWFLNVRSCQPSFWVSSELGRGSLVRSLTYEDALSLYLGEWWMTWLFIDTLNYVYAKWSPPSSSVKHKYHGTLWTLSPKGSLISSMKAFCLHGQMNQELWLHYSTLHNSLHYSNSGIMDITTYYTSENIR